MRLTIRPPIGLWLALFALVVAVVAACSPDAAVTDPLLCGFDGDATPGYQEVGLNVTPHDGAVASSHEAATGSTNAIDAYVRANLLEGASLCNTEVTFEVTAGGGHLSSSTAHTSTTLVSGDYVATVQWTLGPAGTQTLHAYVTDDPSIEATITLTATVAVPAKTVNMYNGTEISVYFVGPGENPPAGGLVIPHAEREITIPTTVGSNALFRAYNSTSTLIASVTCQVTVDAWTAAAPFPLVVLDVTAGYHLTCSGGLLGL